MTLREINVKQSHSPQALAWGFQCATKSKNRLSGLFPWSTVAFYEYGKPLKRFYSMRCRNPKLKLAVNEKSFEFAHAK